MIQILVTYFACSWFQTTIQNGIHEQENWFSFIAVQVAMLALSSLRAGTQFLPGYDEMMLYHSHLCRLAPSLVPAEHALQETPPCAKGCPQHVIWSLFIIRWELSGYMLVIHRRQKDCLILQKILFALFGFRCLQRNPSAENYLIIIVQTVQFMSYGVGVHTTRPRV